MDQDGKLITEINRRGVGRSDGFGRWPDGIVPYRLPGENMPVQRERVQQAVAHWIENTRMSFVEVTDANESLYPNHIEFQDSQGCASYVGRIGGAQPILLSENCSVGSVIHEIGHAVGLFHEHTRADRDSFVSINFAEIQSGKENNFAILNSNELDFASYSPYDYGSIMHYGEYFFSRSSNPTIIVPDGVEIGQRTRLSAHDIASVNAMYATDLSVDSLSTQTTNDGVEIVMSVTNLGSLGAHDIELLVRVGDDSVWTGISPNSGWACETLGADLRCIRDTLRENTESRFSLLVDPVNSQIEDLAYSLSSRTLDTNESNNAHNDSGIQWQTPSTGSNTDESRNVAANGDLPPSIAAAGPTDDDAGTGTFNPGFIVLLLTGAGWRMRRLLVRDKSER